MTLPRWGKSGGASNVGSWPNWTPCSRPSRPRLHRRIMNQTYIVIIAVATMMLMLFIFAGILVSRYRKVGPNQVLIVSGRKVQLPDGRFAGFRFVKGGGTFVFPLIEKADILSLEVMVVDMPGSKA